LAVFGRVEEGRDELVLRVRVADDRRLVGECRRLLEGVADGVEPRHHPVAAVQVAPERRVLLAEGVPLLEVGEHGAPAAHVDGEGGAAPGLGGAYHDAVPPSTLMRAPVMPPPTSLASST